MKKTITVLLLLALGSFVMSCHNDETEEGLYKLTPTEEEGSFE